MQSANPDFFVNAFTTVVFAYIISSCFSSVFVLVRGVCGFVLNWFAPLYIFEACDPHYMPLLNLMNIQVGRHLPQRLVAATDVTYATTEVYPYQTSVHIVRLKRWFPCVVELIKENQHSASMISLRAPFLTPTDVIKELKPFVSTGVQEVVMTELGYSSDSRSARMVERPILVLSADNMKRLFNFATKLFSSEAKALKGGVILHGFPGCGKSTVARELAVEYGVTLCRVPYSSVSTLSSCLDRARERLIVLIDDVELILERDELKHALQEVLETPRRFKTMFILTTNRIDKIPAAVRRNRRIDLELEFTPLEQIEAILLCDQLVPEDMREEAMRIVEPHLPLSGAFLTDIFELSSVASMKEFMDEHIKSLEPKS